MRHSLVLKEQVESDLLEAYNWYESKKDGLGESFLGELDKYFATLEKDPKIYQTRKANRRYCPMKRFPYVIVYEIEKSVVVVYAVFNTYQHPSRLDTRT